jgi:hypothetical protein
MSGRAENKTCFVIMGFGEKTDFTTQPQRTLDLDKTYRTIIKPAVEEAGLICVRADEVIHSSVIDKPMYEYLLNADLVVADLSTYNPNAIYELGIRHALRPRRTIVLAESRFKFPFDVGHLNILSYEHLGKGIDYEEAQRTRGELKEKIEQLIDQPEADSPVYVFIPGLTPPALVESFALVEETELKAADRRETIGALMDAFRDARAKSDWVTAKAILSTLHEKLPRDAYITQQLALATYKAKLPDVPASLNEARDLLQALNPHASNDAETLGLWGAVQKRLWEETNDNEHLEQALQAYEKGFYLRDDHYNGINYAFLLHVRASISQPPDSTADAVLAGRVSRRVIEICKQKLDEEIKDEDGNVDREETFWLRATLVEAYLGTGDTQGADREKAVASSGAPEGWMIETMNDQLAKLEKLTGQTSG